jgi:hypothetical protein
MVLIVPIPMPKEEMSARQNRFEQKAAKVTKKILTLSAPTGKRRNEMAPQTDGPDVLMRRNQTPLLRPAYARKLPPSLRSLRWTGRRAGGF